VRRTGDIGLISVTGGKARFASGVRRIEALTGELRSASCQRYHPDREECGGRVAPPRSTTCRRAIAALMEERKRLERDLSERAQEAGRWAEAPSAGAVNGGKRYPCRRRTSSFLGPPRSKASRLKDLKSLADDGKKAGSGRGVVAIVGVTEDGKAGVVVGVTPDLIGALQRGRSGTGRPPQHSAARGRRRAGPNMAQAGWPPTAAKAGAALDAIRARYRRRFDVTRGIKD